MKTRDQVLNAIKNGRKSECAILDGRDYARLCDFFPVEDWVHLGFSLKDGEEPPIPKEWTEENLIAQLKTDLDFAFGKALDCRGISSGLMYEVIKMWMWIFDDDLQYYGEDKYAMYGLPLYKAVAIKYGFENPIGEDTGNEAKYDEH